MINKPDSIEHLNHKTFFKIASLNTALIEGIEIVEMKTFVYLTQMVHLILMRTIHFRHKQK